MKPYAAVERERKRERIWLHVKVALVRMYGIEIRIFYLFFYRVALTTIVTLQCKITFEGVHITNCIIIMYDIKI